MICNKLLFIDYTIPDDASCPQRQVHVWLQHGSYPVINASSTDEFPTEKFYMERSYMDWLTLKSAFKPSETLVHPIYAPEPGMYLDTIFTVFLTKVYCYFYSNSISQEFSSMVR